MHNPQTIDHPSMQLLTAFGLGKLEKSRAAEVERHVSQCDTCCRALETVEDDRLARLLRAGHQDGETVNVDTDDARSASRSTSGEATVRSQRHRDSSTDEIPATIGRYKVVKQLGKGGMGAVYLANDPQLDRNVALKVPHFLPHEKEKWAKRFIVEAQAAATLDHPNICPVYEVGESDGKPFLAMGYIDGNPLDDLVERDKPLPQRQAALIVRKLALALAEAHEQGVVHRDLKPANIMINRRKEPIVMDFGLAQRLDQADSRLTGSGVILGTPAYMSPEQARGKIDVMGPPCDIYSLGVILYELLTGRTPFQGPVSVVLGQILYAEIEPPSEHRADIDPRLEAICLKATAKEIEDRFASMTEFADVLTDFLRSPKKSSRKVTQRQPAAGDSQDNAADFLKSLAANAADATRKTVSSPRGQKKSYPNAPLRTWIAVGVGVILLLSVVIFVSTNRGRIKITLAEGLDEDIAVSIEKGGKEVAVADKSNNWEVRLWTGEYKAQIKGNPPNLKLNRDSITLSRGGEEIAKIVRLERVEPSARADHQWLDLTSFPIESKVYTTNGGEWFAVNDVPNVPQRFRDMIRMRINYHLGKDGKWIYINSPTRPGRPGGGPAKLVYSFDKPIERFRTTLVLLNVEPTAQAKLEVYANDKMVAETLVGNKPKPFEIKLDQVTKLRLETTKTSPRGGDWFLYGNLQVVFDRDRVAPPTAKAPFTADEAKAHQQAWADYLGVPVEYTNSIGMKFRLIPPGEFLMGSGESPEDVAKAFDTKAEHFTDEHPQHKVEISKAFALGMYEVTQSQWKRIMTIEPWKGKSYAQAGADYPATYVSWNDGQEFCRRLSMKDGCTYCLPTEAQWEYACRAGSHRFYSFGDSPAQLGNYAWFVKNAWDLGEEYAHRVGLKIPNAFGMFDMHGNVWEWCADRYGVDYYGKSPHTDPKGPSFGDRRVLRGGSCNVDPHFVRFTGRVSDTPDTRLNLNGFRVARTYP